MNSINKIISAVFVVSLLFFSSVSVSHASGASSASMHLQVKKIFREWETKQHLSDRNKMANMHGTTVPVGYFGRTVDVDIYYHAQTESSKAKYGFIIYPLLNKDGKQYEYHLIVEETSGRTIFNVYVVEFGESLDSKIRLTKDTGKWIDAKRVPHWEQLEDIKNVLRVAKKDIQDIKL